MRKLLTYSYLANIILIGIAWWILPSPVAIHFDAQGVANGFAPGLVNALIFFGMNTLLFFAIYFGPQLTMLTPARWVNLPNKSFWLAPENRPRMMILLASLLYEFGISIFAFMFVITLLTIQANRQNPPDLNLFPFWVFFGLFICYSIAWIIKLYRTFRVPK